jgi:eukaryotic-like serine/threonine-protein kinase
LVQDSPSPRKIESSITPQMQQIIYRAMEREPAHRYSTARDFAHDLVQMQDVTVEERRVRNLNNKTAVWTKNILIYVAIAAVPIVLFVLLMLAARRR